MKAGEKPHQPLLKGREGREWHCTFTSLSMYELAKWQSFGTSSRDVPSLFTCVLSSLYEVNAQIYRRVRDERCSLCRLSRSASWWDNHSFFSNLAQKSIV